MGQISIDQSQVLKLVDFFRNPNIPHDKESITHSFSSNIEPNLLANCYFAIVAICHQTSPLGERRLEGYINDEKKVGWDYLKEKFFTKVIEDLRWSSCDYWEVLTPNELSKLYCDEKLGLTLNRVNERTFLINDLGCRFKHFNITFIREAFDERNQFLNGESGFLKFLTVFEAYKDPVMKKSQFFCLLC